MNRNIILIILYMFRSNPKLRSLLINHMFCVIIFSSIYIMLFLKDKKCFKNAKNIQDILYFTTTTHSSVGYGDIFPVSPMAKTAVMAHHVTMVILTIELFYCFFCS